MATDLEKLVVQLSADIKGYEREMRKAQGVTDRQAKAIENRYRSMSRTLDGIGQRSARGLIAPLTGIAAALSAKEVLDYADAWTRAKNSLSVAGVQGAAQKRILDELYQSAQANGAPIEALTGLYGKAAQAGDVLGASQSDLIKFSDGVAVALRVAGTSAGAANGALTQLGQLLGSTRVQAEEFNSVNDGARPILQAVANGLNEAGGSVSKLKQLVNDGKVSGQQFFQAFLKGLPQLREQAASATQTLEQGYTKVGNALTKYIGETDSSLGASQRLVQALNAMADNFDTVADGVLQVAFVIAGALVGRSLTGMILKLGLASTALFKFVGLLRQARTAAAFGALGSGLGPIGAIIGVAATAATLFATSSDRAAVSTENASDKANRYADALKRVRGEATGAGEAVEKSAAKFVETETRRLSDRLQDDRAEFEKAAEEVRDAVGGALGRLMDVKDLYGDDPVFKQQVTALETVRDSLDGTVDGSTKAQEALNRLARLDPGFSDLADRMNPLLDKIIGISAEISGAQEKLKTFGAGANLNGFQTEGGREAQRARAANDFLNSQMAIETRTAKEKELAALTEKYLKAAQEAGKAITEAEAQAKARLTLEKQASRSSFEGVISGFTDRVVGAESGGDRFAKNSRSSATGLGQFIESTWLSMFKKHFPDQAAGLTDAAILALRTDANYSRKLIEAYARDNAAVLQKAGVSVNEVALQLAHFLGPQGAVAVLKAAPGTPVSQVLGPGAIKANPEVLGGNKTVDDVIAYGQKRAGMTTSGTDRLDARANFDKALKEQQRFIDSLKAETAIRAALNPLVDDYGRAMSTIEAAQFLLTEAQREGTDAGKELKDVQQLLHGDLSKLSPAAREQALAMRALAEETGKAEAAGNQLTETQGRIAENSRELSSFTKGILSGFIQDLKSGKSAGEALSNVLGKLADRLLEVGVNWLVDGPKQGSGGGLLGGIFSGIRSLLGFDKGGYTGNAGVDEPAGVVHGKEFVVNAKATAKNRGLLEAINKGLPGFKDGGYVGSMSAPILSRQRSGTDQSGQRPVAYISQTFPISGAISGKDVQAMVRQGAANAVDQVKQNLQGWQVQLQRDGGLS